MTTSSATIQKQSQEPAKTASRYPACILKAAEDLVKNKQRSQRWSRSPHKSKEYLASDAFATPNLDDMMVAEAPLHSVDQSLEQANYNNKRKRLPSSDFNTDEGTFKRRHIDQDPPPSGQQMTDPVIIDSSSDDEALLSDSDAFDDPDLDNLDQSVFDQTLAMISTPDTVTRSQSPVALQTISRYPNGSPFPPFLHPCLLDSSNEKTLGTGRKCPSVLPKVYTCFRTAEILRLSRYLSIATNDNLYSAKVNMFGTVHKVKYADRTGKGQGIVFGDLFFPNKPPYITAISRIPYSTRNLIADSENKKDLRPIVKATILLCLNPKPTIARSNATKMVPMSSAETGSPDQNIVDLEVLEVRTSSWNEVSKIKSMIDKDFNAKQGENPNTKTLQISDTGCEKITISTTEDATGFEDAFSDADISLADIEHLFKVHRE